MKIGYLLVCALILPALLVPTGARSTRSEIVEENAAKIYLAFFSSPSCLPCDAAWDTITLLSTDYPNFEARRFDIIAEENANLLQILFDAYNLPSENRDPTNLKWVFIGDNFLSGGNITERDLRNLIEKYRQTGAEPPWEKTGTPTLPSALTLLLMTISTGLADGVNPCAFAVVVFFVSYLAYLRRGKREITVVGISYILGVFITYLLIGLALLLFVGIFTVNLLARSLLKAAIAAFALIVGSISLYDYYLFRKGRGESAKLQLPRAFKGKIHAIIRKTSKTSFMAPLAFAVGFVISFVESACTGQVFFPYLGSLAVLGLPMISAFIYLLLYNLMFILPLLAVFALASLGVRSQRIAETTRRHLGEAKLLIAMILFALAVYVLL